jgi:KipI family sensor histidine kinase inhibitor
MIGWRPAGDGGLLIETDEPPARLAAAVTGARLPGVRDVVPGASTVLVVTEPGRWHAADLAAAIGGLALPAAAAAETAAPLDVPVVYDGADLADVARLSGLQVTEVIALHQRPVYTVGWLGFAPGFGYLTGLDDALSLVPRLASPRVAVPAGSVAIASGMAAVYPSASPGGWRLLGRTVTRMWDPGRQPPALLAPGRKVRFTAVPSDGPAHVPGDAHGAAAGPGAGRPGRPGRCLEVIRPGPLATVQDLGRPGYGSVGVPPSGAADAASLVAANRLAGNPDDAAGIELTLGRAVIGCSGGVRLATSGAPAPVSRSAGPGSAATEVAFGTAFDLPSGGEVRIGAPAVGLRTYVTVAGGVAVDPVLGSRSADVFSRIGGGALRPGDVLPVGTATRAGVAVDLPDRPPLPARGDMALLRVHDGPRLEMFGADALGVLCGSVYTVTSASNRTGLRLDGPALPRRSAAELPSEGVVTGSLQVPHDGRPIVLLADHPTVGGYPVIAVVASADLGLAGQLRPGDQVAFTRSAVGPGQPAMPR